ncbi:MAG: NADH:flavin oxidoreductase [Pseudomonadota bacterium]
MKHSEMKLFSGLQINQGIFLNNRLFFSSVGLDLANEDGSFSDELYSFYKNMIDGEMGMVNIGNSTVSPTSRLHATGLALYNSKHAKGLEPIISYAAQKNVLLVIQLQHYGAQGSSRRTGTPLLSPSGQHCKKMARKFPDDAVAVMSQEQITDVINDFAHAATLVKKAGGKAVQIQAGNGYLISSFLSPYTNHRDDEYGGSDKNRGRILFEIINEIQLRTNNELTVFVRLGIDDCFDEDVGQKPHFMKFIVQELERLGVAGIECSLCIGETFNRFLNGYDQSIKNRLFEGSKLIKTYTTKIPVGCTGLVSSIDDAESLLKQYKLDYIGMARALLADPKLLPKYKENIQGHICRFDGYCFRDKSNPELDRVYCCVNPEYLRNPLIKYE